MAFGSDGIKECQKVLKQITATEVQLLEKVEEIYLQRMEFRESSLEEKR